MKFNFVIFLLCKLSGNIICTEDDDEPDMNKLQRHMYTIGDPGGCPSQPRDLEFREELIIRSQRHHVIYYHAGTSCTMKIKTKAPNIGLIVSLTTLYTKEDCKDLLTITTQDTDGEIVSSNLCGELYHEFESSKHTILSPSGYLEIVWSTAIRSPNKNETFGFGFELTVTPYALNECPIVSKCYHCGNDRFIHKSHICNGKNNCGDMSDEAKCGGSRLWIILLVPSCIILLIFIIIQSSRSFMQDSSAHSTTPSQPSLLPNNTSGLFPYGDFNERTPLCRYNTASAGGIINPLQMSFSSLAPGRSMSGLNMRSLNADINDDNADINSLLNTIPCQTGRTSSVAGSLPGGGYGGRHSPASSTDQRPDDLILDVAAVCPTHQHHDVSISQQQQQQQQTNAKNSSHSKDE